MEDKGWGGEGLSEPCERFALNSTLINKRKGTIILGNSFFNIHWRDFLSNCLLLFEVKR